MIVLRRFRILSVFALFLLSACVNVDAAVDPGAVAAAAIVAEKPTIAARIEADVAYLADDAREGREAGTRGYESAAQYVAARMAGMGLKPGGDKGWFQQAPLRAATPVLEAAAVSITDAGGETTDLTHLEDFRVFPSQDSETFEITAPTVFIGFGVHAPDAGHDDFEGLDVEGKVAVYFQGAPDFFDSEERAHYSSGSNKAKEIAARGAVGIISLFTTERLERTPWERFTANPSRVSMTWVGPDGRADVSGQGIRGSAVLHPDTAAMLFEGAVRSYTEVLAEADSEGGAPKGFDLPAVVSMKGAIAFEDIESPNVVGIIPGADPVLKDEYVVLTAHLDHTGINEKLVAEGKDGLHNGAMDNALGVATMLEVARRLKSEEPPSRSVVVLALTAEEKGLLGADYFAHFPTVEKEAIAANVNLDMPVMLHSFTDVVAFGAERSSLGPVTAAAVAEAGLKLSPDPFPHLGIFTRSDHYRFVEQGVPAVYLFPGFGNGGEEKFNDFMTNHYHKPSDDVSLPILYEDAARFADVNYRIALGISNMKTRPVWNEGDFFGDLFAGK